MQNIHKEMVHQSAFGVIWEFLGFHNSNLTEVPVVPELLCGTGED